MYWTARVDAKLSKQYSGRDITTLESDIDAKTEEFMTLIRTHYEGSPVDMAEITRFYTLDVLSTVAFGRTFGFMAANKDLWDFHKETLPCKQIPWRTRMVAELAV